MPVENRLVSPRKCCFATRAPGLALALTFLQPFVSAGQEMTRAAALDQGAAEEIRLPAILNKAMRYCRRLERAALDFVCMEEISEKIDYSRDRDDEVYIMPRTAGEKGIRTQIKIPKKKQQNTYLYDLQFTRKGELKRENRNLLEKNGKKAKEKDAPLETSVFQVRNVLFGPLGLLGENRQGYYDYQLVGEEDIQEEKFAVIDAVPKKTFTGTHGYGRVWIREADGAVLKIEWKPESIPDLKGLEARAIRYHSDLSVILITEYGFEKNGLRFPSRDYSEEAYVQRDGQRFIRSRTSVIYRDYRFFTVETDVAF